MNKFEHALQYLKDGTLFENFKRKIDNEKHIYYVDNEYLRKKIIQQNVHNKLIKQYKYVLDEEIEESSNRKKSKKIWTCWLQGVEQAPLLVKTCIKRMREVFGEKNVIVITNDNLFDYLDFPDYIIEKWKKGIITNTHFSNLIRTGLLIKYGGTWIDATILVLDKNLPKYFTNDKLFVFSHYEKGAVQDIMSSFMSAYSESRLLKYVQKLEYEYWKDHNTLMYYNLYHLLFFLAEQKCQEEWNDVHKYSNHLTHLLRKVIFDKYDKENLNEINMLSPIQKLSYKKEVPNEIKGTYYKKLIIDNDFDF